MNEIRLKGLLRDIEYSHNIKDTEYYKANIIVPRADGKEDILNLRFKQFACPYKEEQEVELIGNLRSFSQTDEQGNNKVTIYVFTYFDIPQGEEEISNEFEIDGRVCKVNDLRITQTGKENLHFILANNIISQEKNQKLNNYIPITAWGTNAKKLANIKVNDRIKIKGQLHSRTYKKVLEDGEIEFRIAHEGVVIEFELLEDEL